MRRTPRLRRALPLAASALLAVVLTISLSPGAVSVAGATSTPVITTTSLPNTETGAHYSTTLAATGGTSPYRWQLASGTTPGGLSLSGTGVLSGTATVAGTAQVDVEVIDNDGHVATADLSLTIAVGPSIATTSLPQGEVGTDYDTVLSATGGVPPYSWSIPTGGIPGGLLLASDGELSGRPGTAGVTTVTLRVADALGATSTLTLPVSVIPSPLPTETVVLGGTHGKVVVLTSPGTPAATGYSSPGGTFAAVIDIPDSPGIWAVTSTGRVRGIEASPLGSVHRPHTVVTSGAAANVDGYWLVSSAGQVFAFGDARRYGSLHRRGSKIVAIVAASGGRGYWLVSSTGVITAFGSARRVASPRHVGRIVAATATPTGRGLWLLSAGGRVVRVGDARPLGTLGHHSGGAPVAIVAAQSGVGYWICTRLGTLIGFGSARALTDSLTPIRVLAAG